MPSRMFPANWPRHKCPACGDPWEVGDPLVFNDDDVAVHSKCAHEPIPQYKGATEFVCPKCNLIHAKTFDCEE